MGSKPVGISASRDAEIEALKYKLYRIEFNQQVLEGVRFELSTAKNRIVELEEVVQKFAEWAEAYPVSVFSEPTPEQVDEVCKTLGFRIDRISAMILRGFTKRFGDLARQALEGGK